MREREQEGSRQPLIETLSFDCIFDLLSDQHRRCALYYLSDQSDGVATLDAVGQYVLSTDEKLEQTPENSSRIETMLRHSHLPKLEDAGLVEYDSRSETVRYWSQPSLEELLEHVRHKEHQSEYR